MRVKLLTVVTFCVTFYSAAAQNDTGKTVLQLSDLSLDKLMNIQVVTASGYLQTTSEAPSTITVITAQEITERGYEQLEDALRDVPGIDMIHINGYAPTLFYFRGMYGAENLRALMMIDGIAENNIIGSNDLAGPAYNLHNVERIEIIWGPASALYGADAFGGVINIITKKGADINGLHAEAARGTFNTTSQQVMVGLKKSNLEFAVSGSIYSTDGPVFTNRDPNYSASYVDKATSFNASVSYYSKNSKTTFGYREYNTPNGFGTYSNSPTKYLGLPPQGNDNNGTVGIVQRDINGERGSLDDSYLRTSFIQNEFKPDEKLNILTRIIYRETGTGTDSYAYVTADGSKLIRARIASYSNRTSGEAAANYSISKGQKLSLGFDFFQDNVESGAGGRGSTFDPTVNLINGKDTVINLNSTFLPRKYDVRNNFGSYLQYVFNTNLLHKTNFTIGMRDDYNSYFGNAFSPRAVIVNQPDDKLTFKFQFGRAFRAPTNLEIYSAPDTFNLKTEKIITYEANVIYSPTKNFRAQLNAFSNHLTDVIVLSNLSGFVPNKNPGIITINGLEGSFDMAFSKNISAFLNFTYQDTRGENLVTHVNRSVSAIPRIKGNAGVTMHVEDIFTVCITGNMVGMRPSPSTDPYGPVAGYFLTNCTISTGKLFDKGITVSFDVRNLFNVQWLDPGFRTADGLVYSTVLEQPGRTGLFKIGIDL
jgi:outer membrane receptor for ferrienterochelin and colicins